MLTCFVCYKMSFDSSEFSSKHLSIINTECNKQIHRESKQLTAHCNIYSFDVDCFDNEAHCQSKYEIPSSWTTFVHFSGANVSERHRQLEMRNIWFSSVCLSFKHSQRCYASACIHNKIDACFFRANSASNLHFFCVAAITTSAHVYFKYIIIRQSNL